jgi:hypothetical protein
MGETHFVALDSVETVISLDENLVQVEPATGGFNVVGRMRGDTIVQVFSDGMVHIYVVAVGPPAPRPPPAPPPPNINAHGAITSFWGDNQYQVRANYASSMPTYFEHALSLHGRVRDGEYLARTMYMHGGNYSHLANVTVGWINDRRDLSFEVGDTAGRLFGPLGDAIPVRGLRAARARAVAGGKLQLTQEIFAGEIRNQADLYATRLTQPAVGANLAGTYQPASLKDVSISFGSSLASYATDATPHLPDPGRAGMLAGLFGRATDKRGFGLELRSSLSAAEARTEGSPIEPATAWGASASHQTPEGTERVDYEGNQKGFVTPLYPAPYPGQQRVSASASRRVYGITGAAAGSYRWTRSLAGRSAQGLSYRLSLGVPIGTQTNLTLNGSSDNNATPSPFRTDGLYLWSQKRVDARVEHRMAGALLNLQSDLSYTVNESEQRTVASTQAGFSAQKRRTQGDRWDGGGRIGMMLNQQEVKPTAASVLAVDQPAPTFSVSAGGNARFIQGPFESFGSFGLQVLAAPTFQVTPLVNLGVQFTPTAAHQLALSLSTSRWMSGGWNYYATAKYIYHFGNSVKAPPIFEFMSYGTIEGRICYDENGDGLCMHDEAPLPGIPVVLSNGARATSDGEGRYRFERLKPGFYRVEVDEAAIRERGRPSTVMLASFELPIRGSEGRNFAVMRSCRIQGHVVNDLDMNGSIDDGEPLFAGPLVVATGAGGTFQGRVSHVGTFSIMAPCGEYDVSIDSSSLPPMHQLVTDEDIKVKTTLSDTPTVKMLVSAVRTIAGDVFIDRNRNGQKDADEPIVPGALVRFGEAFGPTDETGAFLLRRLPAGKGELVVDPASLPPGLRPGEPSARTLPNQAAAIEDVHLPVVPE